MLCKKHKTEVDVIISIRAKRKVQVQGYEVCAYFHLNQDIGLLT